MVTSWLFMHSHQPLWNSMSRVAAAAIRHALDIEIHSGYTFFKNNQEAAMHSGSGSGSGC